MSFSTITRRENILALLNKHDRLSVEDLSTRFKVSKVTIRKDLDLLESHGHLIKTYGGAMRPQASNRFFTLEEKGRRHRREKVRIAEKAAALIEDEQCLYMDSGSTVAGIIPHIASKQNLTLIVNSLRLAMELGKQHRHRIIIIGGEYREDHLDTVGNLAPSFMEDFVNITLLIGADGIDPDTGILSVDMESSSVVQSLLPISRRVIVCADHTKFTNTGHYRVLPLDAIHDLVTDRSPGPQFIRHPRAKKINIVH